MTVYPCAAISLGMNVDGSAQIGPVSAPLQLDFKDDVFENLGTVFTVHFEANRQDLNLFAEYQYVKLDPTATVPNGPSVDIDFTIQAAEFGAGYRVTTWGNTDVEPILGVRWAYQDLETQIQGRPTLVDSNESFCQGLPFLALTPEAHLTPDSFSRILPLNLRVTLLILNTRIRSK